MNPVAKWLGITVAVILLLISGATLLVSRLIDEAELKLRLLEMVNSSLDGTLEINGELSLSLWPRLSLALGDVHLRTPAGVSEDFASASELRLGVNLMPLLRRQVSVDELLGLTVKRVREPGLSPRLERRVRQIERLSPKPKQQLLSLIDTFIAAEQLRQAVNASKNADG